jgi:ribosomal protein S18 acetylase RimI-like enzyme
MTADDAPAVAALHAASWRSAYRGLVPDAFLEGDLLANRRRAWAQRWAAPQPGACGWVIEMAGELLAFTYTWPDPAGGTFVDNLHVAPDHKRLGLGRLLLRAVVQSLDPAARDQPLALEVLDGNAPARAFYARLGAEFTTLKSTAFFGSPLAEWRCEWRPARRLLDHLDRNPSRG